MKKYISLALWVLVFELVSAAIGLATQHEVDSWYQNLTRPPFLPPDLLFPVMWTILYALIAATGWTLWRTRHRADRSRSLLTLFAAYMVLNWSWSFVFFGAHLILAGFIWILGINILALLLIVRAWGPVKPAALLMIPPTLWTLFAAYLNGGIWLLN